MLKYSSKHEVGYPLVYTLSEDVDLGDVWQWVLSGDYRDKDFKWQWKTFYFKDQNDYLMFMLKWS